jgi:hypothetical protein
MSKFLVFSAFRLVFWPLLFKYKCYVTILKSQPTRSQKITCLTGYKQNKNILSSIIKVSFYKSFKAYIKKTFCLQMEFKYDLYYTEQFDNAVNLHINLELEWFNYSATKHNILLLYRYNLKLKKVSSLFF